VQATSQIIGKLRNARFQPPNGGAKEKLAWINDGEADLLRLNGGSGKKRKFGLPSFGFGDRANSVGSAGESHYAGDGRGGQVNTAGTGPGGDRSLRQVNGQWTSMPRSEAVRMDAGNSYQPAPVAPPVPRMRPVIAPPVEPLPTPVAPPIPRMAPRPLAAPVIKPQNYGFVSPAPMRAPVPTPRMKPAAPMAPKISPQNYGFVAPAMTPRAPVAPAYQNPGRSFPARTPAPVSQASVMRQLSMGKPSAPAATVNADRLRGQYSQYRSPPGDMRLARPEVPADTSPQNYGFVSPQRAFTGGVPVPRQNPLSDTSKFTYGNRDRDAIFANADQSAISRLVGAQEQYGKPVRMTSGAGPRLDPAYNRSIGGVRHSAHMQGNAFDVALPDATGVETANFIKSARARGFTGIGGYRPGKVHVDTGAPRAWGPTRRSSSISKLPASMREAILGLRGKSSAYAGLGDEY